MATNLVDPSRSGSFLLELLYFAGWKLAVRDGGAPRVRARRGDVELDVSGSTLAEAVGVAFARAMRSGHPRSGIAQTSPRSTS